MQCNPAPYIIQHRKHEPCTDRAKTVQLCCKKQKSHEIFRSHGIFWCSKAIQIRTISLGCNFCRFSKGDGLCSFFIVEGYQNLIIIQVNRIDEGIHQRLPLVFQAHIQLTEPQQPEPDELLRDLGLCQLLFRNAGFKLTLGFFQLLQPLLGGAGQNTSLYRVQHILDTGFRIPKLFLIEGNVGVLLVLQFHHLGDDRFHGGIVFDKLHRLVDHQIFQPLFTDGLFLAALVLFGSGTFIVAVDFTRPACAAFAKHQRPTVAAEQLGGKQIVVLCLSTGRGFLVFGDLFLHILKKFQRNDGRDGIRYDHIPEFQFSNVPPILEHMFNAVICKRTAHRVLDAIFVQPITDLLHGGAFIILLERFQHERGGKRVDVKFPLGIQRISKRSTTTVAAAFQDVLCLSTDNLFGKVGRVVFCIALQNRFQNDTLWPLGDDLRSRHELDTVLLQLGLIPGTVVAIPGKAVKFPDQNNIKQLLVAVLYHLLELRAIIRLGRDGAVNVVLDDSDVILFGIGRAFTNLAFDGFFALVITGIAGVDHSGHGKHLSLHVIERWSVLSKHCFV